MNCYDSKADTYAAFKFICLLIIAIGGCAQLGTPAPQNTEQTVAYMYPAIGSVADVTTGLLRSGKITKAEAQVVLNYLENTRSAVNVARDYARTGNTTAAEKALLMAKSVLREARRFIGLPEDNVLR